ncbi:MAG: pantoate--beta-alanine ligase [Actinobacteria bacterium]|nr:pantoate--beta-alanine ligase [Actinomycetota bacterium]
MRTVARAHDLRALVDDARAIGSRVGFVPTMGYFHAGHRSLMRAARAENDFVVVSLFVNPLQFGPTEDLSAYPSDLDRDSAAAEAEGVDVLFTPTTEEIYPRPIVTTVHVDGLTNGLCGRSRPTHFDGVTTVVAKLFSMVGPCRAYFGRKDAQQLAVVRRMAEDLDLPVEVIGCPLVREPDGLAMSSRNAYLEPDDRRAAAILSRALHEAAAEVANGERDADSVHRVLTGLIATEPRVQLDYAEVVDAHDLTPVTKITGDVLVAVAANVGRGRLIDNMTVSVGPHSVDVDLGVVARETERV